MREGDSVTGSICINGFNYEIFAKGFIVKRRYGHRIQIKLSNKELKRVKLAMENLFGISDFADLGQEVELIDKITGLRMVLIEKIKQVPDSEL